MIHEAYLEGLAQVVVVLAILFLFVVLLYFVVNLFSREKPIKPWRETLKEENEKYWHDVEDRELRFERFAAWTECPECLFLDLHRIKDTLPFSCRRQCSNCKYVWRQI